MSVVPSASITSALKKDTGLPVNEPIADPSLVLPPSADGLPVSIEAMAFNESPVTVDMAQMDLNNKHVDVGSALPEPVPDAVLKKLGAGPVDSVSRQAIVDMPGNVINTGNTVSNGQTLPVQPEVLYPELQNIQSPNPMLNTNGVVQAGKPQFVNGQLIIPPAVEMHRNTPTKVDVAALQPVEKIITPSGQASPPVKNNKQISADSGVPINLQLASQMG